MVVGTPELITPENFGDDRTWDLGAAGGQILPFPIDFDRHRYNTLALPCECVITCCMRHNRGEMYIDHGRLCVCLWSCLLYTSDAADE